MRLIATSAFPEAVALGMELPSRPGQAPLMRAGVALGERERAALRAAGINRIYVEDELGDGIELPLAEAA